VHQMVSPDGRVAESGHATLGHEQRCVGLRPTRDFKVHRPIDSLNLTKQVCARNIMSKIYENTCAYLPPHD
jgi:hypothetical protein